MFRLFGARFDAERLTFHSRCLWPTSALRCGARSLSAALLSAELLAGKMRLFPRSEQPLNLLFWCWFFGGWGRKQGCYFLLKHAPSLRFLREMRKNSELSSPSLLLFGTFICCLAAAEAVN